MVLLKFGWKKSTPSCFTSSTKLRWFLELVTHYIYLFITYVCIGFLLSPYYSIYSILSHHRNHVSQHYHPTHPQNEAMNHPRLSSSARSWEWSTSSGGTTSGVIVSLSSDNCQPLVWSLWCSDGKCTSSSFAPWPVILILDDVLCSVVSLCRRRKNRRLRFDCIAK